MVCFHPIKVWRSLKINPSSGKRGIVFDRSKGYVDMELQIPCGQCIGCRLERSRQWAIRCVHEASLWEKNSFITLTVYDNGSTITSTVLDGSCSTSWELPEPSLYYTIEETYETIDTYTLGCSGDCMYDEGAKCYFPYGFDGTCSFSNTFVPDPVLYGQCIIDDEGSFTGDASFNVVDGESNPVPDSPFTCTSEESIPITTTTGLYTFSENSPAGCTFSTFGGDCDGTGSVYFTGWTPSASCELHYTCASVPPTPSSTLDVSSTIAIVNSAFQVYYFISALSIFFSLFIVLLLIFK